MHCFFQAPDGTRLSGMILELNAPTLPGNVHHFVNVMGKTSTQFDLPPGDYRYEFSIISDAKFTLSLFVNGAQVTNDPNTFDPNDATLGNAARVGRVSRFTIKP